MSVEDIERNIRSQQIQGVDASKTQSSPQHQRQSFQHQMAPPPGMGGTKNPIFPPQSPLGMQKLSPGSVAPRIPPGFPMNMLPPHLNAQNMGRMPPASNVPPHALNNFPVHPNFNNPMRSNTPRGGPQLPMPPHMQMQQSMQQQSVNQFNKRLVQEIQQNHPMLPFNRMNNNHIMSVNMGPMHGPPHPQHMHQGQHQRRNSGVQSHGSIANNNNHPNNRMGNGIVDHDYDEYANLMSNRDKQWLIGIQLSQLNTGTPYIDDFYFTVFRERKARLKGITENKAHKDNQMNHPLTQPTGHAHLVLISMSNKNGTNQQRNSQRERKNSESKDKETPRTYTPLQFENSLGKLQCGSVTAPRKIIDMDVVGPDSGNALGTSVEISTQRKSRQILLHIETLYRVALKLEDLDNPTAIATALVVRERKEKERQQALELELLQSALRGEGKDGALPHQKLDADTSMSRSSLSVNDREESRDELMAKLLAGLTTEKVIQIVNVRKGKVSAGTERS